MYKRAMRVLFRGWISSPANAGPQFPLLFEETSVPHNNREEEGEGGESALERIPLIIYHYVA